MSYPPDGGQHDWGQPNPGPYAGQPQQPTQAWGTPSQYGAQPGPVAPDRPTGYPYLGGYQTWSAQPSATDPGLNLPWYGIGFWSATVRAHKKWARYDGRASRGEFWWFYLFYTLAVFALMLLMLPVMMLTVDFTAPEPPVAVIVIPAIVALLAIPEMLVFLSLSVRRLHDAGYSGWYYLLAFVPMVGGLIVLFLMVSEPKAEGMRFDNPMAGPAPVSPSGGW
ncbi:MAG: DUF805 domain-containing protein [Beutenbergiaceae bacterium]